MAWTPYSYWSICAIDVQGEKLVRSFKFCAVHFRRLTTYLSYTRWRSDQRRAEDRAAADPVHGWPDAVAWLQHLLEGPGFYSETKPLISATCSFATRLPLIVRRESFWATLMKRRIFASCALFRGATISNRMDQDCKTSHKNTSWTFENASAFLAEFQPLIDRVRQRRLKERRYHGKPARTAFVSPLKPQTE